MFVGILLPKDLDEKDEEDFFNILKKYTEVRMHDLSQSMSKEENERLSHKIGDYLVRSKLNILHGAYCTTDGKCATFLPLRRPSEIYSNFFNLSYLY